VTVPVSSKAHVVVVGGSVAAITAAQELRSEGFDGRVTLLSAENKPPYFRPPLSKGVLDGSIGHDAILLPSAEGVGVRLNTRAVALNPADKEVRLESGDVIRYDKLVIATGERARRVAAPGSVPERVVRTMDDALALKAALSRVDPGGVTIAGSDVAEEVTTSNGRRHQADVVLTAVGCQPNVEWLSSTGLARSGGLLVDSKCRVTEASSPAGMLSCPLLTGLVLRAGRRGNPVTAVSINQKISVRGLKALATSPV
jgi:NADPH-dependent 2,4-dienoyl-CoA reductase/sulfur reductase-like enzyme